MLAQPNFYYVLRASLSAFFVHNSALSFIIEPNVNVAVLLVLNPMDLTRLL